MNIAIIDDINADKLTIMQYINMYFSSYCSDMPLSIHTFDSGDAFLYTFRQYLYDFIFIDYYMETISGLETAQAIRMIDQSVILIFTTASRDFAIDSYKVKASGYLVKPFTYEELSEVISLIDLKQIHDRQFIEIISGYNKVKILLKDIVYCDISGHYTQVHTLSMGLQRARMTFSEIIDRLQPYHQFLLCYRGCLVNMEHIIKIENLTFLMRSGERIPFRKKEQKELMKTYSDFLFEKVRGQR